VEIYTVICCCLFKQCSCTVLKKREVLIIQVFVEAELQERKEAIFCRLAPFVNLVVYLRGHADGRVRLSVVFEDHCFSPLKSLLAVSGLICREVF